MSRFMDLIRQRILLADGAMGTQLYNKGIYLNSCFDELNLTNPGLVEEVHRDYVRSGIDVLETNTFAANRFKLKKFGLDTRVAEINQAGVRLARAQAGDDVLVAGSIGPLGVRVQPWGTVLGVEAEEAFALQAGALAEAGIDLFILETFSDPNEIRQAITAARRAAPGLPIVAEMTIDETGNSLSGATPEDFTSRIEEWGADVVGLNCSVGPAAMLPSIERMARVTKLPLSAMPNAGVPREVEGRNIYLCSPDYMAEYAKRFILGGVKLIGGCCGTTPAHIKAMRSAVKALQAPDGRRPVTVVLPGRETGLAPRPMAEKSSLAGKLARREFVVCVEIVPPRGPDPGAAVQAARRLKEQGVDCLNIPDGPRATARMSPMALAFILSDRTPVEILLHYTCRDRNLLGMQSDLLGLHAHGIRNLLCVTGDPPKLGDYPDATAVFDVDAIGLTRMVSSLNHGLDLGGRRLDIPTEFLIGVGANPGAINLEYEISRLARKVEAGAEFCVTQPVFDVQLLEDFLERIESFRLPVIAGLWPLASLRNAEFMHNEVPGACVPATIMDRMRRAQDLGPEAARREGVAIARETLAGIKGSVQGVQISPPFGRVETVLEVLGR
jgi:methionine synthase I (cobalamin-dependent)/5,10-methylenetetrahydrofolate reductase